MDLPLIFQDNTSTITLVTKGGGKMRNKTMRVKQAVILEGFKNGDYEFKYVPTEDMVADIYTKALSGMKYYRFKRIIMDGDQESKAAGVRGNKAKMADLNLIVGALPGGVSLSVGHSKWGVAWELGSSLGVGEGSAKVRQRMSALDRPGGIKFYG